MMDLKEKFFRWKGWVWHSKMFHTDSRIPYQNGEDVLRWGWFDEKTKLLQSEKALNEHDALMCLPAIDTDLSVAFKWLQPELTKKGYTLIQFPADDHCVVSRAMALPMAHPEWREKKEAYAHCVEMAFLIAATKALGVHS